MGLAADVTPEQVWDSMRMQLGAGGEVTADLSRNGDTLTVSDIAIAAVSDNTQTDARFGQPIQFRASDDGAVSILFPMTLDVALSVVGDGEAAFDFTYSVTHEGLSIRASGAPGDILHEIDATGLSFTLAPSAAERSDTDVHVTGYLGGLDGSWRNTTAQPQIRSTSDYTADVIRLTMGVGPSPDSPLVTLDLSLNNLAGTGSSVIPNFAIAGARQSLADLPQLDTELRYQSAKFNMRGGGAFAQGQIGAGGGSVSIGEGQLRYTSANKDVRVRGGLTALPLPADLSFDDSRFTLGMPLAKSDDPLPVELEAELNGLVASEFLWSLVDSGKLLPRDPARLFVEMDGSARWLVDPNDTKQLAKIDGQLPLALEQMTLHALILSFAGAQLTGGGSFTFDNTDLKSFDGLPRPIGALDLTMTGGLPLLNKLAQINLVPTTRAKAIEQLAKQFTKRGSTRDSLTTRIEIDPKGQISANGLPLQ